MVRVKICGITNLHDARWSAKCGADAIGFNFVPGSPRYVSPETASQIRSEIPPFLCTVGVFANEKREGIEEVATLCRLHCVQLHGDESPELCRKISAAEVIKAFRISDAGDLKALGGYEVDAYLLDAKVEGMLGGTGRRIEPSLAREASRYGPIILAGGLTPGNVAEAVRCARPVAVDAAGGIEKSPGVKSDKLVEEFIRNAKHAG